MAVDCSYHLQDSIHVAGTVSWIGQAVGAEVWGVFTRGQGPLGCGGSDWKNPVML